jgi:hypothetical protein
MNAATKASTETARRVFRWLLLEWEKGIGAVPHSAKDAFLLDFLAGVLHRRSRQF